MLDTIKRYLINIPGYRTDRKLLIIESDDWGSIRMPNYKTYKKLQDLGAHPEKNPYLKYDALASQTDLLALFEILNSVKDKNGNPATITANCVVANPNFDLIKKDNFENYHYELFTQTLQNYPEHAKSFSLWKEGMKSKLFCPQYHGREHLNIYQWMEGLRMNEYWLKIAFENKMISISSQPSKMRNSYMEGLDYFSEEEKKTKAGIIIDGMKLFEETFNYTSKSFIANCYIWDNNVEIALNNIGVKLIQGIPNQLLPNLDEHNNHKHIYKKHFMGQKNKLGQRYLIRNVFFEPSLAPQKDWLSDCLKRIDIAFKCKKPAIIGSHRLNYIGFLNENNRKQNLKLLKKLLLEVQKKWPEVEFMATPDLEKIF